VNLLRHVTSHVWSESSSLSLFQARGDDRPKMRAGDERDQRRAVNRPHPSRARSPFCIVLKRGNKLKEESWSSSLTRTPTCTLQTIAVLLYYTFLYVQIREKLKKFKDDFQSVLCSLSTLIFINIINLTQWNANRCCSLRTIDFYSCKIASSSDMRKNEA